MRSFSTVFLTFSSVALFWSMINLEQYRRALVEKLVTLSSAHIFRNSKYVTVVLKALYNTSAFSTLFSSYRYRKRSVLLRICLGVQNRDGDRSNLVTRERRLAEGTTSCALVANIRFRALSMRSSEDRRFLLNVFDNSLRGPSGRWSLWTIMNSVVCFVSDYSTVDDDRVLRVEEHPVGSPRYSVIWIKARPLLLDKRTVLSVGRKFVAT